MKNIILFLYSSFFILHSAFSQAPTIQWQKCIGGSKGDLLSSIIKTNDGGYIAAGSTASNDGDVSGNHDTTGNTSDAWIVKLDSDGIIKWQKCYGGSLNDYFTSIIRTKDSGYIAVGATASNNGDVSGNHGQGDIWVVKLDSGGTIKWQKCYGGSKNEGEYGGIIQQTIDSGYIIVGSTNSTDSDVSGFHLGVDSEATDSWVIKIDIVGNLQWQKCLGGSYFDYGVDVQQTSDGGYMVTNYANSNDGDVSGNHGFADYWIVKLDGSGGIKWQKCYGGTNVDLAQSGRITTDKGYILGGCTSSNDGDVIGYHGAVAGNRGNYWIVKTDSLRNIQHQKCLGGADSAGSFDNEYSAYARQTSDSGYITIGYTSSNDGDVTGNHGYEDIWLVKLDTALDIEWEKCFGGSLDDFNPSPLEYTKDGGFIFAGCTESNDGDVSGNHGGGDGWVVKLSKENVGINEHQQNIDAFTAFLTATNNLMLRFFSPSSEKIKMRVMDITGRVILQQEFFATAGLNKHEAAISFLAKGIYLAQLLTSDGVVNAKFVKE